MELMKQNRIQAEALVTYKFRLEDYRRMIAVNMNKGRHKAIKTIVAFQD
jgi:(R,R)-butanediol dehydrogenase/meso-butanediol dehydrogenase/diacetyl reductase